MSYVWVLQMGHSGDGCDLALTLCRYDLREGGLFLLRWGSISCGGGVCSILSLR